MLQGGLPPQAYVYPAAMRSTRDLIRRRLHLVRKRGQLLAHIQNTRAQYNLPVFGRTLAYRTNRDGVVEHFPDPSVQKSVAVDLALIDQYDALVTDLELTIVREAKRHNADAFHRLRSVPGIGKVLALTILYEIHDITRFDRVQDVALLQTVPGVGLITATALVALVTHIRRFPSGRPFASFLGLTPREDSTGSRRRLGAISKRGDVYLRMLMTHGARSVLWHAKAANAPTALQHWALQTERRRGHNVAAVAVANKLARIVWAVWAHGRPFATDHRAA